MSPVSPHQSPGSKGLRPSEEAWRGPFERLLERFPHAGSDAVARALRDAGGHAGRAAAALRILTATLTEPKATSAGTARFASPGAKREDVKPKWLGTKREDSRVAHEFCDVVGWHAATHVQAPAEAMGASELAQNQATFDERGMRSAMEPSCAAAAELVEALANEGRQLRRELDSAVAEARAERIRADLAEQAAAVPAPEKAAEIARMHFLLQAEAAAASLSCSKLGAELEESRGEGRKLRRELQAALAVGADGAAAAGERERLRKELDVALAQRPSIASRAADRSSEVRHEFGQGHWRAAGATAESVMASRLCGAAASSTHRTTSSPFVAPHAPADPVASSSPPRAARPARQGIGRDILLGRHPCDGIQPGGANSSMHEFMSSMEFQPSEFIHPAGQLRH